MKMNVSEIFYADDFEKHFKGLPKTIKRKALKTEKLFKENAFHPSLRLHKLKGKLSGLWSISVDKKYRITFEPQQKGEMLFLSIGTHAIYE
jgi:addiction module RelE/StbE family toxin